jgi:hypothetical protein
MKAEMPGILRLLAILSLIGGVVLGVLDAYGVAKMPVSADISMAARLPALVEAVAIVLGLIALGVLLYGVAELMSAQVAADSNQDTRQAMTELRQSMQRLQTAVDELAEHQRDAASHGPANFNDMAPADTMHGAATSETLHQVMTLLHEIRELALMNDSQRQQRLADSQRHKLNFLTTEVRRLMDLREWAAVENAVVALETDFPDYPDLPQLKAQIEAGKKDAEQGALEQLRQRVENLMAVWAWDQAYAETARFVENFPGHAEGQQLLYRVMAERDNYIENTANRLYEEIRLDIDRRLWRRAMGNAVKLLESAPGHKRSAVIRAQLKTIRENAEIEERQEQERRIQELIRGRQFFEAIDLAQDLLQKFPTSPQAESLKTLLPKLRELAMGHEAEAQASS